MAQPTIYDLLLQDHKEVKDQLNVLADIKDPDDRARLLPKLKETVDAHSQAEEAVFYKRLKKFDLSQEPALEGFEEHQLVSRLLIELDQMKKDNPRWGAKLSVLKDMLEHHMQEEEENLFKKARQVLSDDKAREFAQEFTQRKNREMAGS